MSWSIQKGSIPRAEFNRVIDTLEDPTFYGEGIEKESARAQFETAKQAAKAIAAIIPGPFVSISLNGHANGVGWQEKSGMANDGITVSVYQTFK